MQDEINWEFHYNDLPEDILLKWDDMFSSATNSCASSSSKFSIASLNLMDYSVVIYATAYSESEYICTIPLFLKEKKICFLNINILQTINHNHLDVYTISSRKNISQSEIISSLVFSARKEINGWDYFQARNLLNDKIDYINALIPFNNSKSAYFTVQDVKLLNKIISNKALKNVNRLKQKLISGNKLLHLETVTSNIEVSEALNNFVEIENSGWKGKQGTSIGSSKSLLTFYSEVWEDFSKKGKAIIYLLNLDGKPIASAISFKHASTIYLHKITYDESLSMYAPGSILITSILEETLKDDSIKQVCFNTYPEWIKRWHPETHDLTAIEFFNLTLKGSLLKSILTFYRMAKHLKHRLAHNA